ncbi:hypothetical protein BDL97_03G100000 [Sphagnum fallax]|nr:hypothetical protein BDL97_03G100000 [Sphagnum fallax]
MAQDEVEWNWWSKETVAVVTGANKGIGFAIVRQLAKQGITVVLTARDTNRGERAVESLKCEGLHDNVNFHSLDVRSEQSALALAEWLRDTYGGIDILINNAAIASTEIGDTFEDVKSLLDTNYFGVKNVTKALLPLARNTPGGFRVVVVSSSVGQLKGLGNNNKYRKILSDRENITEDLVDDFVYKYLEEVENGTWKEGGWSDWTKLGQQFPLRTYSVSKLAVNAYVSALHNSFAAGRGRKLGQLVNVFSCCPGLVDTDLGFLGRPVPKKTPEQGADTPVWLALYSPEGGSGKFWSDRNEKEF